MKKLILLLRKKIKGPAAGPQITRAQRDLLFRKNKTLFDVEAMQKKFFEAIKV